MKRFRTLVVTKKHIKRAAAAGLAVILGAGVFFYVKSREPQAEPAFADAQEILDAGVPHEREVSGLRRIMTRIFGMDAADPESIINESSRAMEEAAKYTPRPSPEVTDAPTAAASEPTEPPADTADAALPTHDEIAAAALPEYKNATAYDIDIAALAAAPLEIKPTNSGAPEVLIMHTHTTECYSGDAMSGEGERTTNEAYNMCAVGDVLAQRLERYGIHVLHDKTIHDYPSYQGSYTRALETITSDIAANPEIKVVIDLHRDAFIYPDGSKLRVAAAMLVLGTDSMGLYHPYWQSNLSFALKIQQAAEIMYPGLMRPIDIRRERFNMHVTKGSVLIEIGGNGNTLPEARTSAEYLGDAIAAALING